METEYAVIGAGVNGLAAACCLAKAGHEVIVFEQFTIGHRSGSSHGGARVLKRSQGNPCWSQLVTESERHWRLLEEEVGAQLIDKCGLLEYGHEQQLRPLLAAIERDAFEHEVLDAAAVDARFGITVNGGLAVFLPDVGVLRADLALDALRASATAHGAQVRERTAIRGIAVEQRNARLELDDGDMVASNVIVTAGAWAKEFLLDLDISLPVVVTTETVAFFDIGERGNSTSSSHVPIFIDYPTAGPQAGEGLYALPTYSEGLKVGAHKSGQQADPRGARIPSPTTIDRMRRWVGERYADATSTPRRTETCLYTRAANDDFLLFKQGPIVVGSACSGQGFKFAPRSGEIIAELARTGAEEATWRLGEGWDDRL